MNRDEIWEHKDGSHWRILATDLSGHWPIAAACVVPRDEWVVSEVNSFQPDAFTRQVRQPRELWLRRDKRGAPHLPPNKWEECYSTGDTDCFEYTRVDRYLSRYRL